MVDGDTLDIDNVRIRLTLVNTPETYQDGYIKAKQFVETNCEVGTRAMVDEDDGQKSGSYDRMIGLVFCENLIPSLNKAVLTSGNAEILPQYYDVSEFSGKDSARQYRLLDNFSTRHYIVELSELVVSCCGNILFEISRFFFSFSILITLEYCYLLCLEQHFRTLCFQNVGKM